VADPQSAVPNGVPTLKRLPRPGLSRGRVPIFLPMTELSLEIHAHNDHTITTTPRSLGAMASNSIKLLTGNSHPALAKSVADQSVYLVLDSVKSLLIMTNAVWA